MTIEAPQARGPITKEEQKKKAVEEGKLFRVGDSYLFAAQIPNNSVGRSASRCSNCNSSTVYGEDICDQCELPFVGPFGFPQLSQWEKMSVEERIKKVEEVYGSENHGRLGCGNAYLIPLNPRELVEFKTGDRDKRARSLTALAYKLSLLDIEEILH